MYLIIHCSNCTFTQIFFPSHKFGFGEGASKFWGGPENFQPRATASTSLMSRPECLPLRRRYKSEPQERQRRWAEASPRGQVPERLSLCLPLRRRYKSEPQERQRCWAKASSRGQVHERLSLCLPLRRRYKSEPQERQRCWAKASPRGQVHERLSLCRLEIGITKDVPRLKRLNEILIFLYEQYQYSPKAVRELRMIGEALEANVLKATNLKGSRWVPYIYKAVTVSIATPVKFRRRNKKLFKWQLMIYGMEQCTIFDPHTIAKFHVRICFTIKLPVNLNKN